MATRIGVLTSGSDCPGLNAAIRAIGKAALDQNNNDLIGFVDGFTGLIEDQVIHPPLSGILTLGGTTLGTSHDIPQRVQLKDKVVDKTSEAVDTYKRRKLDALICIGGNETQEAAAHLAQQGLRVITLPKGVDNEIVKTDFTIGFDTALSTATEAIDRLHSTAHSHHRMILVEILGRHSGWLTLGAGIAGGADVIVIPEIPYDLDLIAQAIKDRNRSGKRFSILAIAEGGTSRETVDFFERSKRINHQLRSEGEALLVDDQLKQIENRLTGNTVFLANQLQSLTGLETRITILGNLLHGGAPTAADRLLATNLGTSCIDFIRQGQTGIMVAMQNEQITAVPLQEVTGRHKVIPPNHPWLESARQVGTVLGN